MMADPEDTIECTALEGYRCADPTKGNCKLNGRCMGPPAAVKAPPTPPKDPQPAIPDVSTGADEQEVDAVSMYRVAADIPAPAAPKQDTQLPEPPQDEHPDAAQSSQSTQHDAGGAIGGEFGIPHVPRRIKVPYSAIEHAASTDVFVLALRSIKDRLSVYNLDGKVVELADQTFTAKVWEKNAGGDKVAVDREIKLFGTSALQPLGMDDVISRHIDTRVRVKGTKDDDHEDVKFKSAPVPSKVSATILARSDSATAFRRLAGIIGSPTLRPDGSLLIRPGYDEMTGYYLAFDADSLVDINQYYKTLLNPTEDIARMMLGFLRELISLFPFHDDKEYVGKTEGMPTISETVAISTIITGVCRSMFPVVPGTCVNANGYGVGKTLLSETIGYIATGKHLPSYFWSTGREENDKLLAALLLKGISFGILDNINGSLSNTLLAQMISSQQPEPRILGENKTISVRQWMTLMINGVGIAPTEDLERRMLYLSMMTLLERPQDRKFPWNPLDRVKQNRSRYLFAVLAIVRWHLLSGGKLPKEHTPLAGFEDWSHVVVGALVRLGCPNPILSQQWITEKSASSSNDSALFSALREVFGTRRATSSEIYEHALANGASNLRRSLMAFSTKNDMLPSIVSIGKILARRDKMIKGGLQLRSHRLRTNEMQWWVEPIAG